VCFWQKASQNGNPCCPRTTQRWRNCRKISIGLIIPEKGEGKRTLVKWPDYSNSRSGAPEMAETLVILQAKSTRCHSVSPTTRNRLVF